jgi:hypothetical protein
LTRRIGMTSTPEEIVWSGTDARHTSDDFVAGNHRE